MIAHKVSPSLTLALIQRVKDARASGKNIASFAAGECDFPTPEVVQEEAIRSMHAGNTRYVASPGLYSLREALAQDYQKRLGAEWVRPENVIISAGAKQGIYLILAAILDAEDEVLVPKPYWVSYPDVVKAVLGVPRYVKTKEKDGFFPTVEELEKFRSARTKAVIFASPANPTGTMISESQLKDIVDWCVQNEIFLIYDEIYERLILEDGKKHFCPLSMVDEKGADYIVSVSAFSKTMAMTGWRCGYVISSEENMKALAPLQGQMLTCLPGFIQDAALKGLQNVDEYLPEFIKRFQKRLKMMLDGLAKIPDVKTLKPAGAFYVCVDVSQVMKKKKMKSDVEFADKLFEQMEVAALPGSSMGMSGWLRLSFATSEKEIELGLKRLAEFCQ